MGLDLQQYIALEWSLFALCLLVVAARLAVRTWRRIWSFWVSEIFLIIAIMFFAALCIGDTYSLSIGQDVLGEYDDEGFAKWQFASSIIFDLAFYFPRFSLLAFYNELFPVSHNRLRVCLYAVAIYTICSFLSTLFIDVFWCGINVPQNWSDDSSVCMLLSSIDTLYINWAIGILSEILILFLPFPLLKSLKKLDKKEKTVLTCIFLFGVVTLLVSITRFTLAVQFISSLDTYLIGSAEIATQIIVVALPALRPLLFLFRNTKGSNNPNKDQISLTLRAQPISRIPKNIRSLSSTYDTMQSHSSTYVSHGSSPVTPKGIGQVVYQQPWESIELPQYLGSTHL